MIATHYANPATNNASQSAPSTVISQPIHASIRRCRCRRRITAARAATPSPGGWAGAPTACVVITVGHLRRLRLRCGPGEHTGDGAATRGMHLRVRPVDDHHARGGRGRRCACAPRVESRLKCGSRRGSGARRARSSSLCPRVGKASCADRPRSGPSAVPNATLLGAFTS